MAIKGGISECLRYTRVHYCGAGICQAFSPHWNLFHAFPPQKSSPGPEKMDPAWHHRESGFRFWICNISENGTGYCIQIFHIARKFNQYPIMFCPISPMPAVKQHALILTLVALKQTTKLSFCRLFYCAI